MIDISVVVHIEIVDINLIKISGNKDILVTLAHT